MSNEMTETAWKPADTQCAQKIWEVYQQQHDLSGQRGKVAAVDPGSGRVWIGDSGVNVANQMQAQGVNASVYLVRAGSEYFQRKGRR